MQTAVVIAVWCILTLLIAGAFGWPIGLGASTLWLTVWGFSQLHRA